MNDYEERKQIEIIKSELPTRCNNCSFLVITDLRNKKVYCPYLVKDECLIGANKLKYETEKEEKETLQLGRGNC